MSRLQFRRWFGALVAIAVLSPFSEAAQAPKQRAGRPGPLDHRIERILWQSEARRGFWGIEVAELPSGRILYSRNAEHLFQPASNMKLFTTAAAIEKLGPEFVFRTTVESDVAPDAAGRVPDLYLVGRGDPNIGSRLLPYTPKSQPQSPADKAIQELAEQVKAHGVREVTGRLVADDSYYLSEPFSHGWGVEDLAWGYGAPVTALAFNDNALALQLRPGAKLGDPGQVWLDPVPDYYQLNNRLETSAAGTEKRIFVERAPGSMQLDVWGQMPLDAEEDGDRVAIARPPQLIGGLFRRALEVRGIAVRGPVVVQEVTRIEGATSASPLPKPPARVVLAEHNSLPLREEIKLTNKVSLNLHAEMLLRTMARELKNFGSLTVGLDLLNDFAAQVGVVPGETSFADGSGLSREDLVAPRAVVKLLLYMAHSPRFDVFFASLPVAGVDGTLAERFGGTRAAGRIHAKTGTVEHTNALSGYMDLPSGKRLAFSIIGNSYPLKSGEGEASLDQIALTLYDWYVRRKDR